MPIEKWSDDVIVVHLADDPQFSDDLRSLEQPKAGEYCHAVLDLSAVHFVNSSNIARLLRLRKLMNSHNRKLILCGIKTQIWSVFLLTGLDKLFSFCDDVPTSLATLQMK